MAKWDLGSDDDDEYVHPSIHAIAQDGQGSHQLQTRSKVEDDTCNTEWNIAMSDVKPPHLEWPINPKELEILMPKQEFKKFARMIFDDPDMWATKSWEQEKFTITKVTHPGAAAHWQQRFGEFAPNKANGKLSTVYPPFVRCLIAEFILHWKVDYRWENDAGKVNHRVHKSVLTIATNRNKLTTEEETTGNPKRGSEQGSTRGSKRKIDNTPREKEKNARGFFFGAEPASSQGIIPMVHNKRAPADGVGGNRTHRTNIPTEINVLDVTQENSNMENICKKLGAEVGDWIEKNLRTKYSLEFCGSGTIDEYKSKLKEAELKIASLEKLSNTSSNVEVTKLKVKLFDKMDEIDELKQQLADIQAEGHGSSKEAEDNRVIKDLRNQIASKDVIIASLQENLNQVNEKLESRSNKDK